MDFGKDSICAFATTCGAFNGPACTNREREKINCQPTAPTSVATDILKGLLPEPSLGNCGICGGKNVLIYEVNPTVKACLNCYISFVLQRRPMPEKQKKLLHNKCKPPPT